MNFSLRGPRQRLVAVLGATLAAASVVGVAGADDVENSIPATVGSTAKVMSLSANGAVGTTQMYTVNQGGDGKPGCNLTGSTTLTLGVASTDTDVATVSPSTITFTACGAGPTVTVTPHDPGSATIEFSLVTNTSSGSFNLAPATFDVIVAAPPNTPPTVSVAGVAGGASYNKGSVPAATCQATDAEDGNSSFAATLSDITGPYASDGIGTQTATCSYTDGGGLAAVSEETYTIVDPTPPTIASVLDPSTPDGSNGWYKSNVSIDWTVTESESPNSLQVTGCEDQTITADGGPTSYSCSATSAGGSTGPNSVSIKKDGTAPTDVAFNSDVPADGGRYFPTTVPTGNGCTASDATSGVASCAVTGRSTAVGTHTLTATATDNAGNTTTATRTYSVRVLTLSGFFNPVDMGGVVNTVKGGSTVPLKFTVADEGVAQTSTSVVKSFMQRTVTCGTLGSATDDIEIVTTGGTSLRYDATAGQFIQNWQTPKNQVGACYVATVTMIDGSTIAANFKLK